MGVSAQVSVYPLRQEKLGPAIETLLDAPAPCPSGELAALRARGAALRGLVRDATRAARVER